MNKWKFTENLLIHSKIACFQFVTKLPFFFSNRFTTNCKLNNFGCDILKLSLCTGAGVVVLGVLVATPVTITHGLFSTRCMEVYKGVPKDSQQFTSAFTVTILTVIPVTMTALCNLLIIYKLITRKRTNKNKLVYCKRHPKG